MKKRKLPPERIRKIAREATFRLLGDRRCDHRTPLCGCLNPGKNYYELLREKGMPMPSKAGHYAGL